MKMKLAFFQKLSSKRPILVHEHCSQTLFIARCSRNIVHISRIVANKDRDPSLKKAFFEGNSLPLQREWPENNFDRSTCYIKTLGEGGITWKKFGESRFCNNIFSLISVQPMCRLFSYRRNIVASKDRFKKNRVK